MTTEDQIAAVIRRAHAEAAKYDLTVDWVMRIWAKGAEVGQVMAEVDKQRGKQ